MTGSIAAYKAADLVSRLTKSGHEVHVVMTKDAQEFITPLTLQTLSRQPVTTDLYDEKADWHPGHIELADNADLLVVAPATANTIAKFANGIADDTLGAIHLAALAPLLIAPAMNGKMWKHPCDAEKCGRLFANVVLNLSAPRRGSLPAATKALVDSGPSTVLKNGSKHYSLRSNALSHHCRPHPGTD